MSASDLLQLLYVIISLLEKVFQYKIMVSKIVSLIWGGVKRATGGLIVFFGISWMGILPVSMWTSAMSIPVVNPYSWALGVGMMILFGFVLEMIGLLAVGYGSMYRSEFSIWKALSIPSIRAAEQAAQRHSSENGLHHNNFETHRPISPSSCGHLFLIMHR